MESEAAGVSSVFLSSPECASVVVSVTGPALFASSPEVVVVLLSAILVYLKASRCVFVGY